MPELKTLNNWPLLMQPIEHAGGEGVARAVCADDRARRQGDRAQRDPRTVASTHHRALREMRRRPAHGAEREHVVDRPCDCGEVSRAVGPPRLASRQRADLVIVDDELIEMRQARAAELGEPLGSGRHQFEIGEEADSAGLAQHRDPAVSLVTPRPVHRLVSAGQSKMENSRRVEEKSKSSGVISAATP